MESKHDENARYSTLSGFSIYMHRVCTKAFVRTHTLTCPTRMCTPNAKILKKC